MRSTMIRASLFSLAVIALASGLVAHPLAALSPVPEIDGSAVSAGLAGLTAGILILRSRRRVR